MIVRVHSLGSLWQTKDLPNGGTRVWNTTGIREGMRIRSCATLFGQILFGPKSKPLLQEPDRIHGRTWVAGDLTQNSACRSLRLACLASRETSAEWHLTKVSEQLVGIVPPEGYDPASLVVVSASQRKQKQELLLLLKPFAWITGPAGSAIFEVNDRGTDRWMVRRW